MIRASHWRSEGCRFDSCPGLRNIFLILWLSLSNKQFTMENIMTRMSTYHSSCLCKSRRIIISNVSPEKRLCFSSNIANLTSHFFAHTHYDCKFCYISVTSHHKVLHGTLKRLIFQFFHLSKKAAQNCYSICFLKWKDTNCHESNLHTLFPCNDRLEHGWAGQLEHGCWQVFLCMLEQAVHDLMNKQTWTMLLEPSW